MEAMDEKLKRKGATDAERALTPYQRQEAINSARASVVLSGLKVSPEAEAIQQQWVRGEISMEECIAEIKGLYKQRTDRKMSNP